MDKKKLVIISIIAIGTIIYVSVGHILALHEIKSVYNGGVLENTIWNTFWLFVLSVPLAIAFALIRAIWAVIK